MTDLPTFVAVRVSRDAQGGKPGIGELPRHECACAMLTQNPSAPQGGSRSLSARLEHQATRASSGGIEVFEFPPS